jgi:hypothetical protein
MPQDVSRLVDICRHSLYFDTIEGVVQCLSLIQKDQEVILVRVKNRFHPAFDSEQSAGYRNLALNLRVVTKETLALGIETHVCEVQLLLVQMAAIKVSMQQLSSCSMFLHILLLYCVELQLCFLIDGCEMGAMQTCISFSKSLTPFVFSAE